MYVCNDVDDLCWVVEEVDCVVDWIFFVEDCFCS